MVESLRAIAAIPELRNRVLFTLGMLAVFRLGSHIPTPGVNTEALRVFAEQAKDTMFGFYDMFSGGNLSNATIFALGVMPYISASIILQLLTIVWPYLERLSKEGELGRRKITQYTRYSTIVLSAGPGGGLRLHARAAVEHHRRPADRRQPRHRLPADDDADDDHRQRLRDVARRADHRARHRQRHVAHHLRRHRVEPAGRGAAYPRPAEDQPDRAAPAGVPGDR